MSPFSGDSSLLEGTPPLIMGRVNITSFGPSARRKLAQAGREVYSAGGTGRRTPWGKRGGVKRGGRDTESLWISIKNVPFLKPRLKKHLSKHHLLPQGPFHLYDLHMEMRIKTTTGDHHMLMFFPASCVHFNKTPCKTI